MAKITLLSLKESQSHKEALKVKRILKKKGIQSKVLNWTGKVPKSNIQQNARKMRYSLMSKYCKKNKIKYLLTAHHMDDQIENFFIRLIRGSGITGLSSMSDTFNYDSNLKIIHTLLYMEFTNHTDEIRMKSVSLLDNVVEDINIA